MLGLSGLKHQVIETSNISLNLGRHHLQVRATNDIIGCTIQGLRSRAVDIQITSIRTFEVDTDINAVKQ